MAGDREPQAVRVTIFNQNYSLLASDDPARVEELAQVVNDIMHGISEEAGTIDAARTAVLACLHLADQVRSLERDLDRVKSTFENRARQFTIRIDEALQSPRNT